MTDSTDRLDQWLDALGLCAGTNDKPRIGVSACLLGRPVRYDGEHKRDDLVSQVLPRWLDMQEYCPETAIGLPVPRPPIQVVQRGAHQRVTGVEQPHRDYTDALRDHADRTDPGLSGFILKARSPSCGLGNTPLTDIDGRDIGVTDGAFAGRLRRRFPALPMLNETHLGTAAAIESFVLTVWCTRMWQRWGVADWLARARVGAATLPGSVAMPVKTHLHQLEKATDGPHSSR